MAVAARVDYPKPSLQNACFHSANDSFQFTRLTFNLGHFLQDCLLRPGFGSVRAGTGQRGSRLYFL